jgi:hypothetical protein
MAKKLEFEVPECNIQNYADVDSVLKSAALLDISKPMTRQNVRILDFVEEIERGGSRIRHRDQALDNGSFNSIILAIREGQKSRPKKEEEIL